MSENLQGLGFAKAAQQFIYKGTTSATDSGDITRHIATEDHSSNRRMMSYVHGDCDPYIHNAIL
jgi:hypothetical protein